MIRSLIVLLFFAAFLCHESGIHNAHAQDEANPRREKGRQYMERGAEHLKKGELQEAHHWFSKSQQIYPSFDVAGNLGLIEVRLEWWPEAANHLSYCLRNFPSGESERLKSVMLDAFQKAKKHVGAVQIEVDVEEASLFVDDSEVGESPLEHKIYVSPGTHEIRAKKDGKTQTTTAVVEAGEETTAELHLQALLDSSSEITPGDFSSEERRAHPSLVPAYLLGGLSAGALGTSMVFRALASGKANEVEQLSTDDAGSCFGSSQARCDELTSAIDTRDTYVRVSNGTLIGAGVGAALTIGYLTYALTKKKQRVNAALTFDDTGGTVVLLGRF